MRKLLILLCAVVTALVVSGCGTGFPNGFLYTQLNLPIAVNSSDTKNIGTYHKGEARGTKLFGLFVWGDTSYEAAVRDAGGFSRVQRVEYFSYDVCGCGYFGIRVFGEPLKQESSGK